MDHFPAHGGRAPATPTQQRSHTLTVVLLVSPGSGPSSLKSKLWLYLEQHPPVREVHKSLSLEVICPWLEGPPGIGKTGHVTPSFGTLSAAAHLSRKGLGSPAAP